jgi:hypothetical protein
MREIFLNVCNDKLTQQPNYHLHNGQHIPDILVEHPCCFVVLVVFVLVLAVAVAVDSVVLVVGVAVVVAVVTAVVGVSFVAVS